MSARVCGLAAGCMVAMLVAGSIDAWAARPAPPAQTAAPSAARAQGGALSVEGVEALLGAFDRDARALQIESLAAALAPEASIVVRTRALGAPRELRFTTAGYLESARGALADLRRDRVRYALEVARPVVDLAQDGRRASALTRSTETYDFPDGRRLVTTNQALLHFEWREGRAVVVAIEQDDLTPPAAAP